MAMIVPASEIKNTALSFGADAVGLARAEPVENPERFTSWLDKGFAGEMEFLKSRQKERLDPTALMPGAETIIVVGVNYYSDHDSNSHAIPKYRIAGYALGEDYHRVLRRILKKLRNKIREKYGEKIVGRICIDSAPFMDIYWAQKAGLGWQGKHTGLVSRQFGNFLLIGSLILNVEMDSYDNPHPNHCGKCRRCLDACPTGALVTPYIMDASKCISYWTIESKRDSIPEDIARVMNNRVFGCDICISACPFNRFAIPGRTAEFRRAKRIDLIETGKILTFNKDEFDKAFNDSPIFRPGISGIRRNIQAVDGFRSDKN